MIVADGGINCKLKCLKFAWMMQNHKFEAELRVVPLGRYDLIFGSDWM